MKHGLTRAQRERLSSLKRAGATLYSLPPPGQVRANAGDMVCIDEGRITDQFIVVSRNGAVIQRVSIVRRAIA